MVKSAEFSSAIINSIRTRGRQVGVLGLFTTANLLTACAPKTPQVAPGGPDFAIRPVICTYQAVHHLINEINPKALEPGELFERRGGYHVIIKGFVFEPQCLEFGHDDRTDTLGRLVGQRTGNPWP